MCEEVSGLRQFNGRPSRAQHAAFGGGTVHSAPQHAVIESICTIHRHRDSECRGKETALRCSQPPPSAFRWRWERKAMFVWINYRPELRHPQGCPTCRRRSSSFDCRRRSRCLQVMTVAISVGPERAMSADSQSRADELKQQGNAAFKGDRKGWARCRVCMGTLQGCTPEAPRSTRCPAPCREALCSGAAVLHQGAGCGPKQPAAVGQPRVCGNPAGGEWVPAARRMRASGESAQPGRQRPMPLALAFCRTPCRDPRPPLAHDSRQLGVWRPAGSPDAAAAASARQRWARGHPSCCRGPAAPCRSLGQPSRMPAKRWT